MAATAVHPQPSAASDSHRRHLAAAEVGGRLTAHWNEPLAERAFAVEWDLRPDHAAPAGPLAVSDSQLLFTPGGAAERQAADDNAADPGPVQTVQIRNTGSALLVIPDGGLVVCGGAADLFQMLPEPQLPLTIRPGGALSVAVVFTPGAASPASDKRAVLRVRSDDPACPTLDVALHGSVTASATAGYESLLRPAAVARPTVRLHAVAEESNPVALTFTAPHEAAA